MSYCAADDATNQKTKRAAWVVVCTPPRCAPDQAEVAALMSRAAIPVVALTTLGGASTEMSGSGRSKKLRIVREYLMNEGLDLDVVVFSDATDVLACVEIKILRRVLVASSSTPSTRRDACSTAWWCSFLTARPSQHGRAIAEK
jgi:hypothetical protein